MDNVKNDSVEPQIWLQQPNEPDLWFERFNFYRLRGSSRSLFRCWCDEIARTGTKKSKGNGVPGAWYTNSTKWNWSERAKAWDTYRRKRDEEMWEHRREELRKREWDAAESLVNKAKQMIEFPLAVTTREQTTGEDGKTKIITIVTPARWGMADAARILDTASKLARLAAEMETSREIIAPVSKITADELAKARAEMKDWEEKTFDDKDDDAGKQDAP